MRLLGGTLAVDVGGVRLVQPDEVLVPVPRRGELSGRGLVDQALDGVHEGLLVRSRVVVPLESDVGIGAVAGGGGGGAEGADLLLGGAEHGLRGDWQVGEVVAEQIYLGDSILNRDRVNLSELGQRQTLCLLSRRQRRG